MRGILLAGGSGTRLHPVTRAISKQLVPVHDKPLVYYPLSVLMLAGIREILVITTPHDRPAFERLLGDGSDLGMSFAYAVQDEPRGIAEALIIGRSFAEDGRVALALGDNLFYGQGLSTRLRAAAARTNGATIFAYRVNDPERYGVVELAADGRPVGIVEKPEHPRSHYAVTGLYFYDAMAFDYAASLRPSVRGEVEISDVNRAYLEAGALHVEVLGRGYAWLDTGTFTALMQAGAFIQAIEERQGMKVACLEEIAFKMGFIDAEQMKALARRMGESLYAHYLRHVVEDR